jgi:GMP synthase-like glutamine amidotransferase
MPTKPFKAAVLVNSPGTSPVDVAFRHAFLERISAASPGAQVDFFDPIESHTYPEVDVYDLIVLTGGGGEHDADAEGVAWIERLKGFVGEMERGRQKCVAVCWGHQVVQVAFGGTVGVMEEGECEVCPVRVSRT